MATEHAAAAEHRTPKPVGMVGGILACASERCWMATVPTTTPSATKAIAMPTEALFSRSSSTDSGRTVPPPQKRHRTSALENESTYTTRRSVSALWRIKGFNGSHTSRSVSTLARIMQTLKRHTHRILEGKAQGGR